MNDTGPSVTQTDRRSQAYSGLNLRHIGLRPRRGRTADAGVGYVDWYEAHLLLSGLGIITCSCIDAFFTLQLLQMGATELNAVMAYLIETDVRRFVSFKISMTALSVVLLIVHKNFRVLGTTLRVEHLLHGALGAYLALICWEVYLLSFPPG